MGTLPPWNLKVKSLVAAAASNNSTGSRRRGDKFIVPKMIQLAAFYFWLSHRHIFPGRPEVPDLNFIWAQS